MADLQKKERLLSGAQPSGELHIGNYLGAIKQWVAYQETHDAITLIVDLHAITVPQKPELLRQQTLELAANYIAMGIDPEKSILGVQSLIHEHAELMWILNTITAMGDLERMVAYKEKMVEGKEALAGLFTYPVLMAADILLYKPAVVPVGQDQQQHVELARELARRFNARFSDTFPIPKAVFPESGARIMSLQDPAKKMSKSHSALSYIAFADSPDDIRKKIKSAVTDSGTEIVFDPDTKPALANLINIYSCFSEKSHADIQQEFAGKGYQEFKKALAELVVEKLAPIQARRRELLGDQMELVSILRKGSERAQEIASETLGEVYAKVGLDISLT